MRTNLFGAEQVAAEAGPINKEAVNPKDLLGAKKPDLSVIPPAGLLHLSLAMMDGANKYGPFNWRDNPVLMRVYIAGAMRHLLQLLDGETVDPASQHGATHFGLAMANLSIIADAYETGNLKDNRPTPGASGRMIRNFEATKSFGDPEIVSD